ncbi:putative LRR receptor-like serine/threonine-protein kinase [Hibiscus syriacus]|uniref:non-specific serine/threonine protein kinase n=1 Tax=Hibiscus syriacus TaxID=106335 RepID=A0A6A2ZLK6_HIBSY|nr:probable LRR receptor-like serine/threonine-protein kinase At3g47570 [Hibiscus syriacus]KAE8692367.1 putative LRR receptor-like serine/threonine-protein kinase [Hibiscus syriacus]
MEYLQFLLLLFSIFQIHLNSGMSQDLDSTTDQQALLSFKLQLTDPQTALSGWTSNSSHCNWFGVTCTTNGSRVESLQLSSLGLVGTLPHSLSNLTSLTTLNLSHNSFHGQFQLEFSRLSLLRHIDLRNNSINGTVPASLSHCHNLETLRLQGNRFTGSIPPQLGNLQRLRALFIAVNNLTGSIPSTFGNLSSLTSLNLARNMLAGEIPSELGHLRNLQQIQLSENNLSGQIPASIFNTSSLIFLSVTQNNLSGNLPMPPKDGFYHLPNLRELYLALNRFEGTVPGYISNASSMEVLDLSRNRFHGAIPLLGNMRELTRLDLGQNLFSSDTARNFQFIDSLANCTQLQRLMINSNRLSGEFPSVANLSSNIQHFCISDNMLTGGFPQGIEMLQNLISLSIEINSFTGDIPRSIATLRNLQSLLVYQNMFSGEIPEIFSNLTRVSEIAIGNNQFSGKVPISLGDCQQLQTLDLSWNRLNGSIPEEIFKLSGLNYLILVHNLLSGPLPSEVGNLKQLQVLDVSENNLFGELTSSISGCSSLLYLNISMNNITGEIPDSLGSLIPLEFLDLSSNNLSGPIPHDLGNLKSLKMLNLSFNHLEGEVPKGNIFSNRSFFSIHGNGELCSIDQEIARNLDIPQCNTEGRPRKRHLIRILVPIAGASLLICLVSCFAWALISRRKKNRVKGGKSSHSVKGLPPLITYSDIRLATNNFAAKNLLGRGGFGSVYEGRFDNLTLAVKVLDLQQTKAVQSFLAECEALRNARHRNLVKIITSCSSVNHKGDQFKALVYEFMPNGNLEKWLYPEDMESGTCLTLLQRLNIAIDVASAMDYLHNDCKPPVVHCDLKPANVLLDENTAAHVGDFGLARFLSPSPSQRENSTMGLKGSVGYIAPEYGLGSKASTSGDVYSFGILLLEMFIAKRPTDGMFKEESSLKKLATAMDRNQVFETVDPRLLKNQGSSLQSSFITSSSDSSNGGDSSINSDHIGRKYEECLTAVIRVGLCCAAQSAKDRLPMRETLTELHDIRKYLLR